MSLQLVGSKLQERCKAWRVCCCPTGPAAGRPARPGAVLLGAALVDEGSSAPQAQLPPAELLADFLEEALAATDELHVRRLQLSDLRHFAVQNAKAAIEAADQQMPAGQAVMAVGA